LQLLEEIAASNFRPFSLREAYKKLDAIKHAVEVLDAERLQAQRERDALAELNRFLRGAAGGIKAEADRLRAALDEAMEILAGEGQMHSPAWDRLKDGLGQGRLAGSVLSTMDAGPDGKGDPAACKHGVYGPCGYCSDEEDDAATKAAGERLRQGTESGAAEKAASSSGAVASAPAWYVKRPIPVRAERARGGEVIKTLEGNSHPAKAGDWIITGVRGERYVCDRGVFEETYEACPAPEE